MADSPVRLLVKIGDPTTAANEAAVDASGNLAVILASNSGVDIGDVTVADFAAALTDADDDVVAFAQTTLRTIGMMYASDGVQWERLTSDGAGSLDVNVTLALPVGSNTIGGMTTVADEVDDAAVSVGGGVIMNGLVFDDTTPVVIEEGDAGYQRMSLNRNAYGVIRDDAGSERGANVTASNELNVLASAQPGVDIGDVDILSVIPGTGAANLGKAEDAASAAGDTGVSVMAIQDAALTALGSVDGDYTQLRVNANGALHVTGGGGGAEFNEDAAGSGGELGSISLGYRQDADTSPVTADGDFHGLIFDNAGALKVNVKAGGGESTPTGEVRVHSSSTDTAVDASLAINEAEAGGTTSKLSGFDASSSVPIKAEIIQVDDGVETVRNVLFAAAGEPIVWRAPHRNYYSFAFTANAGFDGWRIKVTNKDSTDAADLYGTIYTEN